MGDVLEGFMIVEEILKSPCTPRPKKDKQVMARICVSLKNPLCSKLLMEEKGKVVNIETDDEEEDL